ncbi:MAG: sugar phosphate isomerase/epimerase [Clostridia bacterium]|nr:sugar phosphate isomerase/epimerase [Clostridia bacterium]
MDNQIKLGLQLYSIRNEMENDMDSALKKVSEAGYTCVEFADFYGKTADEINSMLEKYGLEAVSAHIGYDALKENEGGIIEFCKKIGLKYIAVPYMQTELHKGSDSFDETVQTYISIANNLRKNGMELLYHNHSHEFVKFEGKYLNDWLIESVGLENLSPEPDVCWIKYAGASPEEYIKKYSGKVPVVHLKDFTGEINTERTSEENNFKMCFVGGGCQDWDTILDAAIKSGTKYFIVEQDNHIDNTPMENMIKSIEFLKTKF